jgi:hypothetical protein
VCLFSFLIQSFTRQQYTPQLLLHCFPTFSSIIYLPSHHIAHPLRSSANRSSHNRSFPRPIDELLHPCLRAISATIAGRRLHNSRLHSNSLLYLRKDCTERHRPSDYRAQNSCSSWRRSWKTQQSTMQSSNKHTCPQIQHCR